MCHRLLFTHLLPRLPVQDRRALFNQWKAENGKSYPTPAAEAAAFAAFSANAADVIAHNSNKSNKFFKGAPGGGSGRAERGVWL